MLLNLYTVVGGNTSPINATALYIEAADELLMDQKEAMDAAGEAVGAVEKVMKMAKGGMNDMGKMKFKKGKISVTIEDSIKLEKTMLKDVNEVKKHATEAFKEAAKTKDDPKMAKEHAKLAKQEADLAKKFA